jgi:hypothetical protein
MDKFTLQEWVAREGDGGEPPLWKVRSAARPACQSGGSLPPATLATALLDPVLPSAGIQQ